MTPEDWETLKQLLAQALDLPLEERAAFVDGVWRDSRELGEELKKLLEAQEASTILSPLVDFHELPFSEERLFEDDEVVLDRVRIVRFLGKGGMGQVYEVIDRHLGRVALKTIRPELAASSHNLERFRQEVQLALKVTNAHVCRIHDLFTYPATARRPAGSFLIMEFLEGITLADRIENSGALPLADAESVGLQLCSALQAIHEIGVIHRDFKSNNVMLVERNGTTHAVVMDLDLLTRWQRTVAENPA